MPRVVPSQVVEVIRHLFPGIYAGSNPRPSPRHRARVLTLLELCEDIPPELMPRDVHDHVKLLNALNFLRGVVKEEGPHVYRIAQIDQLHRDERTSLDDILDILARCPDAAPAPATIELLFITDPAFREELRIDISTAYQVLANGEWKAATVLAGSVVEALLLWALQQQPAPARHQALTAARTKDPKLSQPPTDLERWNLEHYIAVAEQLQLITADTATQARLAKDFRNLIHPGRAQRLARACTRGTALGALAAVELVVTCFTP